MKRLGPGSVSLAAVVLASLSASQAVPGAPSSELSADGLTVDPNPAICFLELDSHGDLGSSRHSFFGDGRVQFDRFLNSGDPDPDSRWSAQLSEAEFRSVVSDLVESGLFAFDPEVVLERERKEGIRRPHFSSVGWTEVGISLLRRASTDAGPAEVVKRNFAVGTDLSMSMSGFMSKWGIPDYPEMIAYRRILTISSDLLLRARQTPKPRPVFSFSFPQDQRPVVVLTSTGVGMPVVTSMTLYESGRAVVTSRGRVFEVQLPMGQLDRVLREFDEGGLASFGGVSQSGDHGVSWPTFTSRFRLVGTVAPESAVKEFSREITVVGPSSLARRFPSIPAYKALANLEELLFETESFALSSRRDP